MSTQPTVFQEIKQYIQNSGYSSYSSWYAGVASNAKERLFDDHKVDQANGRWIYRTLSTDDEARTVEEALLALGCKGGPGGGDASTNKVYAYLITSTTVE